MSFMDNSTEHRSLTSGPNSIEWRSLVAWDVAASFGPALGTFELVHVDLIRVFDASTRTFLVARLVESPTDRPYLIKYRGTNLGVVIDENSPNIPRVEMVHDLSALLQAFIFIRDNIDYYRQKPMDDWNYQLSEFLASSGLKTNYFNSLMNWFSPLTKDL